MGENDTDHRTTHASKLAEERTRLARERTILAHIRTGFASFLFGTAIIGLFPHLSVRVLGGVFILIGVLFVFTGYRSYVLSNRRVRHLLHEVENSVRRLGHE